MNKYFHMIPLWKSPIKLPVELPVKLPVELPGSCRDATTGHSYENPKGPSKALTKMLTKNRPNKEVNRQA